jgi:small-conductance mechanosensitive channel
MACWATGRALRRLVLALVLLLAASVPGQGPGAFSGAVALAQTQTGELPDYEAWERVASRAEDAVRSAGASDQAYEELRAELVTWRARFEAAQKFNADRIETVERQLAALGPPPAEGESEPEDVAARRAELQRQLEELKAPVRRAEEAFQRAEGLIREIDKLLAARRAEKLLTRSVSPLNPVNWPPALLRLQRSWVALQGEVASNWKRLSASGQLGEDLPLRLGVFLVALALLLRGRKWAGRLAARWQERFDNDLPALVASFGEVALPTAGVYAIVRLLNDTGLPGLRLGAILEAAPILVLAITLALWVAERVFPSALPSPILPKMQASGRLRARQLATLAALVFGLHSALVSLAEAVDYDLEIVAVAYFPGIVLEGALLFLLGRLMAREAQHNDPGFQTSAILIVARALMAVGLFAPLAAAAGYTNLALRSLFPAGESLLLLGILAIFHNISLEFYRLIARVDRAQAQNSLVPIIFTSLAVLGSLPVFALIWGTRPATLAEYWMRLRTGFQIGETRIQPGDFVMLVVVFTVGYMLTRLVQNALRTTILPKTRIEPGAQNAIVAGVGYVGVVLAALFAISTTGLDLSSLALVAGALSVGIGFGLQNIVSNFVSGIILLIERPIAEGDWVEVGGHMGTVKSISVRSTRIETFDRQLVIVPNADFISSAVVNWTRGNLLGRVVLRIGVAYGSDTRKVEEILTEIVSSHDMVLRDPPPRVTFEEFGADSLNFVIRAVIYDVNQMLSIRNELNHRIYARLTEEGIQIPFPQRDVWLKNPEDVAAALTRPARDATPGR